MLEFGKHTAFILWSYGLSGLGFFGLIVYTYLGRGK